MHSANYKNGQNGVGHREREEDVCNLCGADNILILADLGTSCSSKMSHGHTHYKALHLLHLEIHLLSIKNYSSE